MTERGPLTGIGATPDPAEPSHPGDAPAPPPHPPPTTPLPADPSAPSAASPPVDLPAASSAQPGTSPAVDLSAASSAPSGASPPADLPAGSATSPAADLSAASAAASAGSSVVDLSVVSATSPVVSPPVELSAQSAASPPVDPSATSAAQPTAAPTVKLPAASAAQPGASATVDLSAVRGTDALVEALAARRVLGTARPADDADPAVRLLHALISDVDEQTADPAPPAPSGPGPRRRGPRTIVALGVAGAVLASTGVAAAGGGVTGRPAAAPAPNPSGVIEQQTGAPAVTDVDAGTHERVRPPVRPEPEPVTARKPPRDPERADIERIKRRLEHMFPSRHHRRPDGPVVTTKSAPSPRPEATAPDITSPDDALRQLDALRREAEKRTNPYKDPRWDG